MNSRVDRQTDTSTSTSSRSLICTTSSQEVWSCSLLRVGLISKSPPIDSLRHEARRLFSAIHCYLLLHGVVFLFHEMRLLWKKREMHKNAVQLLEPQAPTNEFSSCFVWNRTRFCSVSLLHLDSNTKWDTEPVSLCLST